jgi:ABC-type lipoprotein export system ATPase subunit
MIEIKDLEKIYPTKERDFIALKGVNLTFEPGEFIAVLGESGSGKTTFLNMISGVDSKTKGKIYFNELDVDKFSDSKWREIRNTEIGFIFQRFNLIDHLTVMENVILPLILTGSDNKVAKDIARKLLNEVGLDDIEDKKASELSGGQRQRVAIARTIIINPTIILADEPSGALDSTTAKEIMGLLQHFAAGRIIIMVTHDEDLAYKNATRVVRLHDGEVISDEIIKEKNPIKRVTTDKLLSYNTKVTRRLRRRLVKQFPDLEDELELGKNHDVPLDRKYIANNPVFTRKIARENYHQKRKINRRILWSFVISISLLLVVNIVMKNITAYNFNLFDVNNNYHQYLVDDYNDANEVVTALDGYPNVDEVIPYYEHYVQEMYLVDTNSFKPISPAVSTYNQGVFSPRMVTIPTNRDNFYLNNQILAGTYPVEDNHILVSSEFVLSRFYEYGMLKAVNNEAPPISNLNQIVGQKLYMCGETVLTEGEDLSLTTIETECFDYVISGVLNSYYRGINYVGNIYVTNPGFTEYIDYLRVDKEFTRVDEYYDEYVAIYPTNVDEVLPINDINDLLDANVTNPELREYEENKTLEDMLYYIYLAIFISLIIISGTIDINIVASSVASRIREIGIYSCIGVSKKSIRNMFVFETVETALRILLITSLIYVGIAFGFQALYKSIVVDLTIFNSLFGVNKMFSYELSFSIYVILGAVGFLFVSVLIPSFRAANMRAIDALRSE